MVIRSKTPAEKVIVKAFLKLLKDPPERASRNLIYAIVAERCGVTYERVVDLCHDRLYVETSPGIWEHGWQRGII